MLFSLSGMCPSVLEAHLFEAINHSILFKLIKYK